MESVSFADIFLSGPRPSFEETRAVKKASRNSLSTSKGGDTPKTSSRVANGDGTPSKGTPKRAAQTNSNSKSTKTQKLDAEALAKEFIK